MKKTLKGIVIKKKMFKTIKVLIINIVKHKIYKKFIKKKSNIYVHDNNNLCNINDYVEIEQCRPISKTKFWILKKIIKKNI